MMGHKRPRGTRLARSLSELTLAATASVGLMGCLVTEEIDFAPPENLPPSIEATPSAEHPLDEVIVLDLSDDPMASSGSLPLEVEVHDPNVEQDLVWRIYVDTVSGPGVAAGEIAPSGDLTRVPDNITVSRARLSTPGCHRVVLIVSEGLKEGNPIPAEDEHYIARAAWWVFTKDESQRMFDPSTCPRSP